MKRKGIPTQAATRMHLEDVKVLLYSVREARQIRTNREGVVAHAFNPGTLGGQGGQIMSSRDQDHLSEHGETLSLLKIKKLAGHGSTCL